MGGIDIKRLLVKAAGVISVTALSVSVISSCASEVPKKFFASKPAEMKQIFEADWQAEIIGNFDTNVTLNDTEYHITSTALDYKEWYGNINYEITINDSSVIYNTGYYYNIAEAYIADPDPEDDSVILFVLPITDNDYKSMTAYKYSSESGIVQLEFDLDGDGVSEPVLEPGRRCSDFELSKDGTFGLITGTNSIGMWGLQRYFRLDENDVLVFEQQDKYKIRYWADGENMLEWYDSETGEKVVYTYEEAKSNSMYGIESKQDYEMLMKGYYSCKQSCDDLRAGDYFKIVYDDNNGHVTFVTSDGREGMLNVNEIGYDQKIRERIGGFSLMLAG
ncbi:MAG: hypothetical protein J1G06_03900 [Oscillospiraceae bacterium]|nr:hypothetical protein [Oscillospiraceae bacterium]